MRFSTSISLVLTAKLVRGDWDKIRSALYSRFNETGLRNVGSLSNPVDAIQEYGCWCNMDEPSKGNGAPVDGVDALCKALHDGYICAAMDKSRDGCEAHKMDYR